MKLGKLKKNLDLSNTPRVVRSFCAFDAVSRTGRKIWFAFWPPSEKRKWGKTTSRICEVNLRLRWSRSGFEAKSVSGARIPCSISSWSPKNKFEDRHTRTRDTRLTVRRCLYCDKPIKVVLHQDTQSFRASFDGILEVGNPSGEVMICSIRVRERKICRGVEGLGGDQNWGP